MQLERKIFIELYLDGERKSRKYGSYDDIKFKQINRCPTWSMWLLGEVKENDLSSDGKIRFQNSPTWDPTKERLSPCLNTQYIWAFDWRDDVNFARTKPVYTEMTPEEKFEYSYKIFTDVFNEVECNTQGENDLRCKPLNNCFLNDYFRYNDCFCNCSPLNDSYACGQGPLSSPEGRLVLEIEEDRLNDKLKLRGIWYNCTSGNCVQSNIPLSTEVWADYGNGEIEDFTSFMSTPSGDPPSLKEIPFIFSNGFYSQYCYDPYTGETNPGDFSGCTAEPYAIYPTLTMIQTLPGSTGRTLLGTNEISGFPVAFASAKLDKIDDRELDIKDYLVFENRDGASSRLKVSSVLFDGDPFSGNPLNIKLYLNTPIYPIAKNPGGAAAAEIGERPVDIVNFESFNISCTLYNPSEPAASITQTKIVSFDTPDTVYEFDFANVDPSTYEIDNDQGKYKFIITFSGKLNIESGTIGGRYLLLPEFTYLTRSVSYSIYYIADNAKGGILKFSGLLPIVKNKLIDGICVSLDCSQLPGLCSELEDC